MASDEQASLLADDFDGEQVSQRDLRSDDYTGLFGDRIFPTPASILSSGDSLLIIRRYGPQQKLMPGHHRLWQLLVRYDSVDAPGDVTVACVWGNPTTDRRLIVYSRDGVSEEETLTHTAYRAWLKAWFAERRSIR